jgi:acetylornithine deacetylase
MANQLSPLELMTKLISFPTVSRDTNLPLVDWVEEYLSGHGIAAHRYWDSSGQKAALFAHVGPQIAGGLVLSGHTDVVPVDGQPWTSDPWTVTERDGKFFGRGTCDMKGFDALSIWALVEAKHRGVTRPLQLALSFDEEIGCTGAPPMIDRMLEALPKASAVIVGEPSMMEAVTGHKGGQGFFVDVWGFEVHSSIAYRGVSAVMEAARIIQWANEVNLETSKLSPTEAASLFDPPYTTLHTGVISGGTAANITAKHCRFDLGWRAVPSDSNEAWRLRVLQKIRDVETEMQKIRPEARIDVEERFAVPGLKPEEMGDAEGLVRSITGDNGIHVVSYGTEAGQFQERGYSAVVCGPGDIAQAHQPDEYVTIEQFNAGHAFMERILERLA